ncbi:MAG: DNA alkylation repair protein, partial [Telluria sp.]
MTSAQLALVSQLDSAMNSLTSATCAIATQHFFPHPINALGVSNAAIAVIARDAIVRNPGFAAQNWLQIADHFARSHAYHEHMILASALAASVVRSLDDNGALLDTIKRWLETDVSNWAQCDDLCIKPLYLYLKRHPHLLERLYAWGSSDSAWCRRASNVGLVKFVGRTEDVDLAKLFANCERLLADPDPYVQKGIGWLLKVASQREPAPVLA